MARHQFTQEECSRGGKIRSQQASFQEGCEKGFEMLKVKRPDAWRMIYKLKVLPHMNSKAKPNE